MDHALPADLAGEMTDRLQCRWCSGLDLLRRPIVRARRPFGRIDQQDRRRHLDQQKDRIGEILARVETAERVERSCSSALRPQERSAHEPPISILIAMVGGVASAIVSIACKIPGRPVEHSYRFRPFTMAIRRAIAAAALGAACLQCRAAFLAKQRVAEVVGLAFGTLHGLNGSIRFHPAHDQTRLG